MVDREKLKAKLATADAALKIIEAARVEARAKIKSAVRAFKALNDERERQYYAHERPEGLFTRDPDGDLLEELENIGAPYEDDLFGLTDKASWDDNGVGAAREKLRDWRKVISK